MPTSAFRVKDPHKPSPHLASSRAHSLVSVFNCTAQSQGRTGPALQASVLPRMPGALPQRAHCAGEIGPAPGWAEVWARPLRRVPSPPRPPGPPCTPGRPAAEGTRRPAPSGPIGLAEIRPRSSALRQTPRERPPPAPRPLASTIPPPASVRQAALPSNRRRHSAGSLPNDALKGTEPAPFLGCQGRGLGAASAGLGGLGEGLVWGPAFPRPPPAARGQEQAPVRTPPWPAARPHPNTCSELQIFIAAARRPQGAGSPLGLRAPDPPRPAPPSRRVGAGRGRGARGGGGAGRSPAPPACLSLGHEGYGG